MFLLVAGTVKPASVFALNCILIDPFSRRENNEIALRRREENHEKESTKLQDEMGAINYENFQKNSFAPAQLFLDFSRSLCTFFTTTWADSLRFLDCVNIFLESTNIHGILGCLKAILSS